MCETADPLQSCDTNSIDATTENCINSDNKGCPHYPLLTLHKASLHRGRRGMNEDERWQIETYKEPGFLRRWTQIYVQSLLYEKK